jgi:putative ABC transport system permease protein
MSWLSAIRTASGGLARHVVQSVVIGVVLLASTASATLGITLLAAVNAPFQHAFAAQHGADAAVTISSARVTPDRLAVTRKLPGVTATAGPFPEATVAISFEGNELGPRTLAGRAFAGGPVDDVVLSQGHWPAGPGQLVLDAGPGGGPGYPAVGDAVTVTGVPGVHSLTVVGFGTSITRTADGWVSPGQAAQLQAAGTPAAEEMLYQFASAGTSAQVSAGLTGVRRALPRGAVAGAASWLTTERNASGNAAVLEPFVIAFALIGLVMAVLIVANLVSGAVVAQYQRIGVLKSIGLTPAQVVTAYLIRTGLPAMAGCAAGVAAGNLAAAPVLSRSSGIYGVGPAQAPWWASAAALAGMLVLTVLAALGPALRAGRMPAVQAIAAGRAPRAGRGYAAHRIASRLRLPRPAGIGLAAPFARPSRSLVTLAAIGFGATAVIFAAGLHLALDRAEQGDTLSAAAPVQIQPAGRPGTPTAAQDVTVLTALRSQPGTLRYVAQYGSGPGEAVKVPGISAPVIATAYGGDASWLGYAMVSGHWYRGPREADVNTTFLADSGLAVGDSLTVQLLGAQTRQVTLRIAGEVFDPSNSPQMLTSSQALPGLASGQDLQGYEVGLRPGTNVTGYLQAVNAALGQDSPWIAAPPQGGQFYGLASGLVGLLAVMVAVAASLGVLNTVLMSTRDRLHDLGIFKAIGMRPSQMLTMVMCWIAIPAVLAAVVAAPAAVALTTVTVRAMAGSAHTAVPASFTHVLTPGLLALLSLGALLIALAGALLPGAWAARARAATALRAE